jgi:hypothetical protein
MRWRIILVAASLGLAGCGDKARSEESAAQNADLLDPATVNAILGADIAPDEPDPANSTDENAASDNVAASAANEAD